jgi:MerR family transcriptional regulator, mercuric resistance operon regulatory protein
MTRTSIGALSAAAGTQVTTIRYYERIGLMPRPDRTPGGHRNYSSDHLRRLTFIRRAREMGFKVEEIRTLLALAQSPATCCSELQQLATAHLGRIREAIERLTALEATLVRAVDQCSGTSCPVLELLEGPAGVHLDPDPTEELPAHPGA